MTCMAERQTNGRGNDQNEISNLDQLNYVFRVPVSSVPAQPRSVDFVLRLDTALFVYSYVDRRIHGYCMFFTWNELLSGPKVSRTSY